jgi:glyoxylase-like metal-dependent hydrolase (beta-lactamase superfamily II)
MMLGDEIRPGLWRWTAYHEEWKEDVGSLALVTAEEIVLIDPLVPEGEEDRFYAAIDGWAGRLHVLITVFWHVRSAGEIARRTGAPVWAYSGARAAIARRVGGDPHVFRLGDELPGGVVPRPARRRSEVVFWLPQHRALVAGDVLLGGDAGSAARLCPDSWLPRGLTSSELAKSLEPLLDLPVELLLVSHGRPILDGAHAALARALSAGAASAT